MAKNRDVRNFLAVVCASVLCAALLTFLFLYFYGPSGLYRAGNALLDPATMDQINAQLTDPKSRKKVHFTFDHMDFSYFDRQEGKMRKVPVSMQSYQKFYESVASEHSLNEKERNLEHLFMRSHPTLLTINMKTLPSQNATVFQVIEFDEEGYFRVQLHERQEPGGWVYFYKKNLYQEVIHLFTAANL